MPAADVLELEDVIVAVDGIEITSIQQLQDYTRAHEGVEMIVTVARGDETIDLAITPEEDSSGVVRMGIQITGVQPAIVGLTAVNRDTERYTETLSILGDADPDECPVSYEYGWRGKPLYRPGPFGEPEQFKQIMTKLIDRLGIGGFRVNLSGSSITAVELLELGLGGPEIERLFAPH